MIAILGEDIFNKAKLKEYKLEVNYKNYLINKKSNINSWNDKEWSKIINLQNNINKSFTDLVRKNLTKLIRNVLI